MLKLERITRFLLSSLLAVAMIVVAGPAVRTAFAQQQQQSKEVQGSPDMPPMRGPRGPSGICADQQHLFVMSGGKIMQYAKEDLKLLKTVDLPKPPPRQGAWSEDGRPRGFPPPHGMGQSPALWPGDGVLYVLAGPKVLVYRAADMSLKATVDLPGPTPRQP